MKKVLYVPLDDRPANLADVIMLGRAAGLDVIVPPANDTANRLDTDIDTEGDLVTGTSHPVYGRPDRISRFILNQAGRVDGFVLSIDMLVYGGLIGSRRLREETYAGSDAKHDAERDARQLLGVIRVIKQAHPEKPIFVLDTLMRLATTTFAGGLTFEAYEESRQLMSQPRLPAETFEAILDSYDLRPDGTSFGDTVHFDKDAYYRARRHKLRTTRQVLEELAAEGCIDFLAIGVDDAYTEGAQANEIAWVEGRIDACLEGTGGQNPERAIILPDADGLGHSLIGRMAALLIGESPKTSYAIRYYGPHGSELINPYEYMSVHDNVLRHIDMIGGQPAAVDAQHTIEVLAITAVDQASHAVEQLEANGESLQPTVVIDFTGFVAHPEVTAALLASSWTGRLLGYSAWNTAGNKIGMALGMGETRIAGLTGLREPEAVETAMNAHGSLLFKRFLKDYYYKAVAIAEIRQVSRSRTPYSNVTADQLMTLFNTPADYEELTVLLRELMQQHLDTLQGQTAFLAGGEEPAGAIRQICGDQWLLSEYKNAALPWDNPAFTWGRAFEIDLGPVVTLSSCPS